MPQGDCWMPLRKLILISLFLFIISTITFALYTDGVNMPHKITTYNPDRTDTVATRLNFPIAITSNVDGILVRVEFPGTSDAKQIMRVMTHIYDPNEKVTYEYDLEKEEVKMIGKFGERVYDKDNNAAMAYITLDMMMGLVRAAYAEMGLDFNPVSNELSIDKTKYIDKIDPTYDVRVMNGENDVKILVSKGSETAIFTYDFKNNIIKYPRDIIFASSYDWDIANNQDMALTDDPYAGISAASAGNAGAAYLLARKFIRYIPYPGILMYSGIATASQIRTLRRQGSFEVEPMPRLPEPEITDVIWINRSSGLVRIEGKGAAHNKPPTVILKNANQIVELDNVSVNGENWSVVNNNTRLSPGENKINVINKGTSNREVESGDITVYLGQGNEPDLVLLSPRDRQVFASDIFPFEKKGLIFEGKTMPGISLGISGNIINSDNSGNFKEGISIKNLNEGSNEVNIILSGAGTLYINKTIFGAFSFICDAKQENYVLRRGDFVFNGNAPSNEGFDFIPYEPNHTGIYTGNGNVAEAVYPGGFSWAKVVIRNLKGSWDNEGFYYAVQVPMLIDENLRAEVAELVEKQEGKLYEIPIHFRPSENGFYYCIEGGQYTPNNNKFYCSELAYWAWEKIASEKGFNFGIIRKEVMFPVRGYDDPAHSSILPAYLCEKSMEVKID
jgi:hypothetical protein